MLETQVADASQVFGEEPLSLEERPASPVVLMSPPAPIRMSDPHRLLELAVERGMPLETIDKLLGQVERFEAMREAERKRLAESAYIRAIAGLKSEVVAVPKTKRVHYPTKDREGRVSGAVDFMHAELSDIMEAIAPAAARVGLTWNYPAIEQGTDWIRVTCRLRHVDGHFEDLTLGGPVDNSGKKNDLQAIMSAITYLQRYSLKTLLGIAEKGDDKFDGHAAASARDRDARDEYPRDVPTPKTGQGDQVGTDEFNSQLDEGRGKSLEGSAVLLAWWGALTEQQRKALAPHFGPMKAAARQADGEKS